MPRAVDALTIPELIAAMNGLREDERESLRVAAYGVWLGSGSKKSFGSMLESLGLLEKGRAQGNAKPPPERMREIYETAQKIRAKDLRKR